MISLLKRRLLLFVLFVVGGFCSSAGGTEALPAAEGVVQRMTPRYAGRVHFELVQGQKSPVITAAANGGILIRAENERECIRAYGYYLRHVAGVHFSWNGDHAGAAQFVVPEQPIEVPHTLPLNYAFNYCTMCYTAVHWDEERWMRELDLLALNGMHYVLVTVGLEKVWQAFLRDIGCEQLGASFIAHPCYSAWWHMGNLEGMGGPVSRGLIESEARLGRAIVQRIVELGMEPVLQGYVGFIPSTSSWDKELIAPQGKWVAGYTRPHMLRADKPEFQSVAKKWYENLEKVYGYRAHAFAGDLFHEGGNTKALPLKRIAAGVQSAMQAASPGSLWFLQAWAHNPRPELLAGLSKDHTVILALQKNLSPGVDISRYYGGIPYVWCELANFGGKQGLYGGFDVLEKMVGDAEGAAGFGLLSEGLETNPLYYELFWERVNNRGAIDRQEFLARYALMRYGQRDARILRALQLLAKSVYTPDDEREGGLENIMCARPGLEVTRVSTWSNAQPYYDPQSVLEAGRLMLRVAQDNPALLQLPTFRYDLVDICREVLANKARKALPHCRQALQAGDMKAFEKACGEFCALISQAAELLATHEDFLLGVYLRGAERRAPEHKEVMTQGIRRLITMWSSKPSSLNDYSHRQFAEMLSHYYLPRWQTFFAGILAGEGAGDVREEVNLNNGERIVQRVIQNTRIEKVEQAFPTADIPLLTEPRGDLLQLAEKALE